MIKDKEGEDMEFTFLTVGKIVFKSGAIAEIGKYVKEYGRNFLIVVDPFFKESDVMRVVKEQLDSIQVKYTVYGEVSGEPTVEQADEVCEIALRDGCDAVISIGGGSNIDVGKAVAVMITNGAPAIDYMEYVGKGKKITKEPAPFISVPTTSGAGSEVTKQSVLGSKVQVFKRSMRSDKMLANLSIIDPELIKACPKKVTACSGSDTMAHLIEAYTTWRANPISDGLALKGIELAGKYLRRAYDDGNDLEAREGMAAAALLGGMALANSGVGAAHGIGMAVGITYHVSHGEACGLVLPHVMRLNQKAAEEKLDKVGEALTGKRFNSKGEGTQAAIDFVLELNEHMGIKPDLKHLNIPQEDVEALAKASYGTSMTSNPIQLSPEELSQYISTLV